MKSEKIYLYYKAAIKYGEGLLDRRSCLMILLAEAKLSNRIAVVTKFKLGAHHNHGKSVESYLIGTYFNINRLGVEYILEEDFLLVEKHLDITEIQDIGDKSIDVKKFDKTLVVRQLKDDNFLEFKTLQCLSFS